MKILVVEDSKEINKILSNMFKDEGYEVISCFNAYEALKAFSNNKFFCVVTDLMMPIMSGEEFIKNIRPDYYGLIIAITAKTSIDDKLKVLGLGADDYIMKPFKKKEVILKIGNYAKKLNKSNHIVELNNGDFIFNYHDNLLKVHGIPIKLTSVEFLIIKYFIENLNKIIPREELMSVVYYDDLDVFDRAIDGHIKNLRKKIKQQSDQEYIKTVYGLGYKFVGDVNE